MYEHFLQEIFSGKLSITREGINAYRRYISTLLEGKPINVQDKPVLKASYFDKTGNILNYDNDEEKDDSVMVIPIRGMLTKYGSWWDYGTEEYADMIREGFQNERVKSIVLRIHTNGGTTHSVIPFDNILRKERNKPVIAVIDSTTMSAGMYLSVLCDQIIAVDKMAECGSIGVMTEIIDDRKMYEDYGLKIIEIIPPESKWKGKAYFEARDGKTQLYIKEELSPWAVHFQDTVKAGRPNLDLSVEGIIEGRTFYAQDAKTYGLIDDIMPWEDVIQFAADYYNASSKKIFNP